MNQNNDLPTVAEGKVPLWIKIMWVLGLSWVIGYILFGLFSTPTTW